MRRSQFTRDGKTILHISTDHTFYSLFLLYWTPAQNFTAFSGIISNFFLSLSTLSVLLASFSSQPSVVGALASVVLAAYKQASNHDSAVYGVSFEGAWWRQLAGIVLCISFAVITGDGDSRTVFLLLELPVPSIHSKSYFLKIE